MTDEELRVRVDRYKVGDYVEHDIEDGYAVRDICVVGTDDLDSLIAAAEARGFEKGKAEGVTEFEKERAETFNKLIDDHDTAFAAGKAEGAEQERERIRNANGVLRLENDDAHAVWVTDGEYFILPAVLLSPAPKEGK